MKKYIRIKITDKYFQSHLILLAQKINTSCEVNQGTIESQRFDHKMKKTAVRRDFSFVEIIDIVIDLLDFDQSYRIIEEHTSCFVYGTEKDLTYREFDIFFKFCSSCIDKIS